MQFMRLRYELLETAVGLFYFNRGLEESLRESGAQFMMPWCKLLETAVGFAFRHFGNL